MLGYNDRNYLGYILGYLEDDYRESINSVKKSTNFVKNDVLEF